MIQLTSSEHYARASLLGKWYDSKTNTYRDRSPEGSHYKYSNCLCADTLEPLHKGTVLMREREAYRNKANNSVTKERLGLR